MIDPQRRSSDNQFSPRSIFPNVLREEGLQRGGGGEELAVEIDVERRESRLDEGFLRGGYDVRLREERDFGDSGIGED